MQLARTTQGEWIDPLPGKRQWAMMSPPHSVAPTRSDVPIEGEQPRRVGAECMAQESLIAMTNSLNRRATGPRKQHGLGPWRASGKCPA